MCLLRKRKVKLKYEKILSSILMDGIARTKLEERFFRSVAKTKYCWNWEGAISSDGYGLLTICYNGDFTAIRVHRLSYILYNDFSAIGSGLIVMHACDNVVCVNPDHLQIGTPKDNSEDMVRKERHQFGEHKWNAVLTESQAISVLSDSRTLRSVADDYGVTEQAIFNIKSGKTWGRLQERSYSGIR